jgi:hypothetical protein
MPSLIHSFKLLEVSTSVTGYGPRQHVDRRSKALPVITSDKKFDAGWTQNYFPCDLRVFRGKHGKFVSSLPSRGVRRQPLDISAEPKQESVVTYHMNFLWRLAVFFKQADTELNYTVTLGNLLGACVSICR